MQIKTKGMLMKKAKIQVKNVYKLFGPQPQRALQMLDQGKTKDQILKRTKTAVGVVDASFDVYEGETLVIMGLSGSGKSTLVRCLNRLHEPTSGEIVIDGQDITKLEPDEMVKLRRKVFGMVFQRFALLPHRTIVENAEFGLEIQGMDKDERRQKAMEALELVGLGGWAESYPHQLSGGMQQRVGLARALAVDPEVLLMDEAFSALDPLIRTEMQDELLSLESHVEKTIVFITHDLDEALKIGDRIVLMKDGKIVQIGTPEEILSNPANDYVTKFVENVDITKVLTAQDVMIKPAAVMPKDGPLQALRKMKEIGIPRLLVVKRDRTFVGAVLAKHAAKAVESGEKDLMNILSKDITVVPPDMPLNDLIPVVVDIEHPAVVVDEDNKVKGIVVESSILATLADRHRDSGEGGESSEATAETAV